MNSRIGILAKPGAILIALSILILGCDKSSEDKGSADQSKNRQYLVIFSQCNNAEPYRAAQNALMEKLFAAAGDVKLVIADAQQDNSKQVAQVETPCPESSRSDPMSSHRADAPVAMMSAAVVIDRPSPRVIVNGRC